MTMTKDPSSSTALGEHRKVVPELSAAATVAAFPLGGIGTGNVSIGARGDFRDWEISNHPDKGAWMPFTFFAIHAAAAGHEPVTRVLEAELQTPYEGDSGYWAGQSAGLPRLRGSRMRGEYPVLNIDFDDDVLPVEVSLTAFTPLVPLNSDDSGIPAAVIRYTVRNPGSVPADVTIVGSMSNPISIAGRDWSESPRYEGTPSVEYREDDHGVRGLFFGTDLPKEHVLHGSAVLATTDESTTVKPKWVIAQWYDGVQLFWDDLTADGLLNEKDDVPDYSGSNSSENKKLRIGSLGIVHTLQPGESRDFEFFLGWHTGNRSRAWHGMVGLPNTNANEIVLNHYAARYGDAWDVVADLVDRLEPLEQATNEFHDSLFNSTVPAEVVDAVTATLVVIRSTTCFRLDNGTPEGLFAGWEGSFNHQGSCEGTCTHVWNYAQSVANIFPDLERSARRTEYLHETLPDGRMRFRNNYVFGGDPHEFHPAVDGQMGTLVRLYREWRFSGDDEFLKELWPNAKLSLDYAFTNWDSNGDFVLDSQQHNTYDIEFYGENSLANSMFFAALRAAVVMAEYLGDTEAAGRYREAAELGSERMDRMLYNGSYYEQKTDDVDAHRYQYGKGCLSDQLLGQTLAHLVGLGHVLPEDHVKSAVKAIFDNNFRTEFHDFNSTQRTYVLNDEQGLLLCSWPKGGRPRIPFVYSDEVWSGIEYQVATHLVYEGFVDEALTIVRAVRDRHDGVRRNPWNEVECGNHYARSMASWGVLLALTGVSWDAPQGTLHLAPHAELFDDADATFFVSTGTGWGLAHFDADGVSLEVLGGEISAKSLTAEHPTAGSLAADGAVRLSRGETARLSARTTS